jgi:thiosulfate dehydrogenase (quinone) large subunit
MKRAEMSASQAVTLVLLRTVVGWHFLYEGLVKLWLPAWGRDGAPLTAWSAAGYLGAANGPFADVFHAIGRSPRLPEISLAVALALVGVGLSLILGLFTQAGAIGALVLLASFYLSNVPTRGVPMAGAEGAYLFVDKNLVEAAAVAVLLAFRTGRIAGLDLWLYRSRPSGSAGKEPIS